MRRTFIVLLAALLAVAGVVAVQRLNEDRRYRGLLASGDRAMAAGQGYLAAEAYSGALAIRPDSMAAYYRRGEAYAADGQERQARRDLGEAHRLAPDAPEPLEALGRLHERRGDFAGAADWYSEASERLHDTDARLLYTLALARYRTGALPRAGHAARRTIAQDASFAPAHYLLGLVARDMARDERGEREAVAALERAVALQPSMLAAREALAGLYRKHGRLEEEADQLEALVALDPRVDRHLARVQASVRVGDHDAALGALAAAEAALPADSRIALTRGRVYLSLAEHTGSVAAIAAALSALERALGGTARRSEGLALYGRALHLDGDLNGAERLLQEAVQTSPVAPDAYRYLAETAAALGHPLIVRDSLLALEVLEGNTAPAAVRSRRGWRIGTLSLEAGDAATALDYLTRAVRTFPDDPRVFADLARALWLNGRQDEARHTLAQALTLSPGDDALRQIDRTFR